MINSGDPTKSDIEASVRSCVKFAERCSEYLPNQILYATQSIRLLEDATYYEKEDMIKTLESAGNYFKENCKCAKK